MKIYFLINLFLAIAYTYCSNLRMENYNPSNGAIDTQNNISSNENNINNVNFI